jgi:oxygen-independent coproporphyrinogen-3 oxidase
MRRYGVTRIAINPQTLNDTTLAAIGRNHTAADFTRAFHMARDAGFAVISCDIIAGLPGEGADDMRRNFEVLERLAPENITVHTLAVKRNSLFAGRAAEYGTKPLTEQLAIAAGSCEGMGLAPYYLYRGKSENGAPSPAENIGYAAPGTECLYNVAMMAEITPIIGVGAGACTKIFKENKISRSFNTKNPDLYISRNISRSEAKSVDFPLPFP